MYFAFCVFDFFPPPWPWLVLLQLNLISVPLGAAVLIYISRRCHWKLARERKSPNGTISLTASPCLSWPTGSCRAAGQKSFANFRHEIPPPEKPLAALNVRPFPFDFDSSIFSSFYRISLAIAAKAISISHFPFKTFVSPRPAGLVLSRWILILLDIGWAPRGRGLPRVSGPDFIGILFIYYVYAGCRITGNRSAFLCPPESFCVSGLTGQIFDVFPKIKKKTKNTHTQRTQGVRPLV